MEDANGNGAYGAGDPGDWLDYYNGVLPNCLSIESMTNQVVSVSNYLALPLSAQVLNTNQTTFTNAPLTFAVTNGNAKLSAATNGVLSTNLLLRTTSDGLATAWLFLPTNSGATNYLTVTAQSGTNQLQAQLAAWVGSVTDNYLYLRKQTEEPPYPGNPAATIHWQNYEQVEHCCKDSKGEGGGGGTNSNELRLEIIQMDPTNNTVNLVLHRPAELTNEVYDLYFRTNLNLDPVSTFSQKWRRILRVEPQETNLFVTNLPPEQGFFIIGPTTNAIRPGFTNNLLIRNDDNHTGSGQNGDLLTNLLADIGFAINFYGSSRTEVFVNNNGNVTFDSRFDTYIPYPLNQLNARIIAPYWADVDTRGTESDLVTYGTNVIDGHSAFGVSWVNVGYYNTNSDKLLSCQMVIISRLDIASGDFDLEFNYDRVEWELGDVSENSPSRVGFSDIISTNSYELPGSGALGTFLDSNTSTGLIYNSLNSPVSGRYVFFFRNGQPLQPLP